MAKQVLVTPTRAPRLVRPSKVKANATPVAAEAPVKRVGAQSTQPRIIHALKTDSNYDGPSKGFNTNKSKTPFRLAEFGTQTDRTLTERTLKEAQVLKDKYGAKPFKRGNLDAGIGNALGAKGFLVHVSGDASSEDALYQFSSTAMKTKFV